MNLPNLDNFLISEKGECFAPHLIFACQKLVPQVFPMNFNVFSVRAVFLGQAIAGIGAAL